MPPPVKEAPPPAQSGSRRRPKLSMGDLPFLFYPMLPQRAWFQIARWQGRAAHAVDRRARQAVRDNLAELLGPSADAGSLDAMTREFFEREKVRRLLLLLSPRFEASELLDLLQMEGLEHLDAALAQQKGVVLLFSHLNSPFGMLVVMGLRMRGYDIRLILPTAEDGLQPTTFRSWLNARLGAKNFHELTAAHFAQFNIRPVVRMLRENKILGFTGDGLHSAAFAEVDFFGRTVPFTTGAISVAQTSGAMVVPNFVVGTAPDRIRCIFEEPFEVSKEQGAVQAAVGRYAGRLEHHIQSSPTSWQHCTISRVFETMQGWQDRSLAERYEI